MELKPSPVSGRNFRFQIVICTAYSDYSWDEIAKSVGNTDKMLYSKPFDNVEVLQMAHALSKKMAAYPDGAKTDGGIGCACKPAHWELRAANAA